MREVLWRGFELDEEGGEVILYEGEWLRGNWRFGYFVSPCNIVWEEIGYDEDLDQHGVPIACDASALEATVGEFTGLYDNTEWKELTEREQEAFLHPKSGEVRKEEDWRGHRIFEGDYLFVQFGDGNLTRARVAYEEETAAFVLKEVQADDFGKIMHIYEGRRSVVGNDFSNPYVTQCICSVRDCRYNQEGERCAIDPSFDFGECISYAERGEEKNERRRNMGCRNCIFPRNCENYDRKKCKDCDKGDPVLLNYDCFRCKYEETCVIPKREEDAKGETTA